MPFERLSADDVYDLLQLRGSVFVVEQRCAFLDPDGHDRRAWHLLGRDGGALVACLRALAPAVRCPEPSIGRVVVAPVARATGLGRVLMREGMMRTSALWPGRPIVIGAQRRLERFYASLGFVTEGVPYLEDDIEHVHMRVIATEEKP